MGCLLIRPCLDEEPICRPQVMEEIEADKGHLRVEVKMKLLRLEPDGTIPNSRLPLIVIEAGLPEEAREPAAAEALLRRNGWQGTWTYTVYDFWHYHTTGHEVLACVRGEARIGFGGEAGVEIAMRPGDAVVVPAGVGHRRLSGSDGFAVVGAYPPGQDGTITRAGEKDVEAARGEIERLALPESDPLTGERPGRLQAWR